MKYFAMWLSNIFIIIINNLDSQVISIWSDICKYNPIKINIRYFYSKFSIYDSIQ